MIARAASVALALGLAACGPTLKTIPVPPEATETARSVVGEEAARLVLKREVRLLRVARRLRMTGLERCGEEVGPFLGVVLWQDDGDDDDDSMLFDAAHELWGVTDRPTVAYVQPGSPADRGDLAVGDVILAVQGENTDELLDVFTQARSLRGPVRLRVRRDETVLDRTLPRVEACHHEFVLMLHDGLTTYRLDDDHAYVSRGFLRFAESDDQLALVVAHELAHRILDADDLQDARDEARAEALGLRLAADAGYDVSAAPDFWDAVACEHPDALADDVPEWIDMADRPHGGLAERAATRRRVLDEIAGAAGSER